MGLSAGLWLTSCYTPDVMLPPGSRDAAPASDAGAGEGEAGLSDADAYAAPSHHPACTRALAGELPESPAQGAGALLEQPAQTCAASEQPLPVSCGPNLPCTFEGECLSGELGGAGLCLDEETPCATGVALGHANGMCVTCVSAATKHALCCTAPAGFDCRGYPGVALSRSRPGELCREHSDCEPGLLCIGSSDARWGAGVGRCLCPEVQGHSIEEPADCRPFSQPAQWHEAAMAIEGCQPLAQAGYSVELPWAAPAEPRALAAAPDGTLHVLVDREGVLHRLWKAPGSPWQEESLPALASADLAAGVDAHSVLHLFVIDALPGHTLTHALLPSGGSWTLELLSGRTAPGGGAALVFDALGQPEFSYVDVRPELRWMTPASAGYEERTIASGALYTSLMLARADQRLWVYERDASLQWSELRDGKVVSADGFAGANPSAALSAAGELYIAFVPVRYHSEVWVARVHEGTVEHTRVWSQDDARLDRQIELHPALAIDRRGRVLVVHATPAGVALEVLAEGSWTRQSLTSEVFERGTLSARLALDAEGALHVFYRGSDAAVRHVFEGSCSAPGLTVRAAARQPAR